MPGTPASDGVGLQASGADFSHDEFLNSHYSGIGREAGDAALWGPLDLGSVRMVRQPEVTGDPGITSG
jgi:hypothetical protein